ncbi:MAG: polyprenyl synthetase family protein [Anaerolineales bacterium]|nr:polyprenyl synthetase family protein [Anaerolineales bacterium]
MRSLADRYNPELGLAIEHLLLSGGKRVRPVTSLLMGGMLGADSNRLVTLASAIELLHTATLVHDDLIDGSLMRRGNATLNAQWSPAATVLTGDFIFAIAARQAAETDSLEVMRLFAETLAIIVNGEINQLFISHGLASRENYYQRIFAKTASMFELATGAAALLSPVDESVVNQAKAFGYQVGMAFQIVDDILDFTGEQTTVGKPVGSDLRQGLITLPALYYYESHPDDPDLETVLNGGRFNVGAVDRLVESIRNSEAIEQAHLEAQQYTDRALAILAEFPSCPEREALAELSNYHVSRNF